MPTFQRPRSEERMLPVEEAQERVLSEVSFLGTELVPLTEASGRTLAEDVEAIRDIPLRDNSAMDGYAIIATDIAGAAGDHPVRLEVIEDVPAGVVASREVRPGTAIRIMTGALIPAGADAVVPVELTDASSSIVSVVKPVKKGENVRRQGEDMKTGEIVLEKGTGLSPAAMGVLASVQKTEVLVAKRPVVAILSTGDEVIDVDDPFEPGKVVNSNAHSLAALVREAGGVPRILGIVADDLDATVVAIRQAATSDFVLSTGGVSVGAFDFVKDALDVLGAETKFWQVAMKPGKPLVLSRLGECLYFGLPGNPVSCMVSFILFVAPAMRRAMGQEKNLFSPRIRMKTEGRLRSRGDRRQYLRVRVVARDGSLVALPMPVQGSGVSTSMVGANGFAVVQEGITEVGSGEIVDVVVFGGIENQGKG